MRVSGIPFVQGRNGYTDSDGRKFGIAIHNTSNDAPAEGEASYATRRTDGTSSHFYVDGDSIVQSLDTNVRAGHAGSRYGNDNAIAFEITGVNAKTRQWWLDNVAWDQLARVCAVLCQHYGIEPRRASVSEMRSNPQVRAFYGHDDMRQAWGGTTHTDPGGNFPWDHLLAKVRQAMTGQPEVDDMTKEEHDALMAVKTMLSRLDGREPIGQAYLRLAVGKDDAEGAEPVAHPTLTSLGKQVAELADRPAAEVDYDQLADALLRRVLSAGTTTQS